MASSQGIQAPTQTDLANFSTMSPHGKLAAYMQSDPATQQAMYGVINTQAQNEAVAIANLNAMMYSVRRRVPLNNSNGTPTLATYAPATTYNFYVPKTAGGVMLKLVFKVNLSLILAAGTSALYALNAGFPYNLINRIQLLVGGNLQVDVKPRVFIEDQKYRNKIEPLWGRTLGFSDTYLQPRRTQASFSATAGTNAYVFQIPIVLNFLYPLNPIGALPIDASATDMQVNITTPTALMGADPDNPFSAAGGTGNGVTVSSGTIGVEAEYINGINVLDTSPLQLDLTGLPTTQILEDAINPLANQSGVRFPIVTNKMDKRAKWYSYVYDGNQSTQYCLTSNVTYLSLANDQSGTNKFWEYGTGTNLLIDDFYDTQVYQPLKQDLPNEGCFPWVVGPGSDMVNVDNQRGGMDLNRVAYPASTPVIQLTSVGSSNTARVENVVFNINAAGLQAVK